jgi:endoglucanase
MRTIYLLSLLLLFGSSFLYTQNKNFSYSHDGIVRLDNTKKNIYLSFTGHDFAEGAGHVIKILKKNKIKASFFLTGDFYRNPGFKKTIKILVKSGNYLGPHSDKHLLYCDWDNRDSTFVSEDSFKVDLSKNYKEMAKFGILKQNAQYFMPPYEWYNKNISKWACDLNIKIVNFTSGTSSNADYTTPSMGRRYVSSDTIYNRILRYERNNEFGLNGFILLLHMGTDPDRTDKMYNRLDALIMELKHRGYQFKTFKDLKE